MSVVKIDKLCTFKYNYEINSVTKYNIISIIFFKLKNSYKTLDKYLIGINLIINNYKKYFPNFKIRLYYDSVNNIPEFIKIKNKMNKMNEQLVHISCDEYKKIIVILIYFQHL